VDIGTHSCTKSAPSRKSSASCSSFFDALSDYLNLIDLVFSTVSVAPKHARNSHSLSITSGRFFLLERIPPFFSTLVPFLCSILTFVFSESFFSLFKLEEGPPPSPSPFFSLLVSEVFHVEFALVPSEFALDSRLCEPFSISPRSRAWPVFVMARGLPQNLTGSPQDAIPDSPVPLPACIVSLS